MPGQSSRRRNLGRCCRSMRDELPVKDEPVKEVLATFDREWMRRYAVGLDDDYEFTAADAAAVKRRLKTAAVRRIQTRICNYFNDRDRWIVEQRHPFSVFVVRYHRY